MRRNHKKNPPFKECACGMTNRVGPRIGHMVRAGMVALLVALTAFVWTAAPTAVVAAPPLLQEAEEPPAGEIFRQGLVLLRDGEQQEALEKFETALQLYTEQGNTQGQAMVQLFVDRLRAELGADATSPAEETVADEENEQDAPRADATDADASTDEAGDADSDDSAPPATADEDEPASDLSPVERAILEAQRRAQQ